MIEKLIIPLQQTQATIGRSIIKTIGYRLIILILDFVSIYLFTHQVKVALGFMIVSNIYTTLGYFLYERLWNKITWGVKK
jgi:uncharacterized membrane protein